MGTVRRVYAEKKTDYAVAAKSLFSEVKSYLGIKGVTNVRVLIRYDIENLSDEIYKKAVKTVFSEPPVDDVYEEEFDFDGRIFSVEYLPGQFDQRADSAEQCVKLLKEDEEPVIHTATTYVIEGDITDEEFERIYLPVCINYDNYLKEFVVPDVIAFYIADNFYKKVLSKASLYNYINSAIDVFNVRCDIDKLIPSIKKILRIKYNLKIVKDNPLILKKFY